MDGSSNPNDGSQAPEILVCPVSVGCVPPKLFGLLGPTQKKTLTALQNLAQGNSDVNGPTGQAVDPSVTRAGSPPGRGTQAIYYFSMATPGCRDPRSQRAGGSPPLGRGSGATRALGTSLTAFTLFYSLGSRQCGGRAAGHPLTWWDLPGPLWQRGGSLRGPDDSVRGPWRGHGPPSPGRSYGPPEEDVVVQGFCFQGFPSLPPHQIE